MTFDPKMIGLVFCLLLGVVGFFALGYAIASLGAGPFLILSAGWLVGLMFLFKSGR